MKRNKYNKIKKKYKPEEIKKMHLLSEIYLNSKQWKEIDLLVNKDYFGINGNYSLIPKYEK